MSLKNIFSLVETFKNREEIILRDYLALERTKLANERTLLSYIRSSLYLLIGGIALIQLNNHERLKALGYVSLVLTVLFVVIGIYRFYKLNRHLNRFYDQIEAFKKNEDPVLKT